MRDFNFTLEPAGSGRRLAASFAALTTEDYARSCFALWQGVLSGSETEIGAERRKLDADGNVIENPKEGVGDYIVVGYHFAVGEEGWVIAPDPGFEGEVGAQDYADALAQAADRGFIETMIQTKAILDRIGGRFFFRASTHEDQIVGVVCRYSHIFRGHSEPDSPEEAEREAGPEEPQANGATATAEPAELEPPADQEEGTPDSPDPDTPEAEHERIEKERLAA